MVQTSLAHSSRANPKIRHSQTPCTGKTTEVASRERRNKPQKSKCFQCRFPRVQFLPAFITSSTRIIEGVLPTEVCPTNKWPQDYNQNDDVEHVEVATDVNDLVIVGGDAPRAELSDPTRRCQEPSHDGSWYTRDKQF